MLKSSNEGLETHGTNHNSEPWMCVEVFAILRVEDLSTNATNCVVLQKPPEGQFFGLRVFIGELHHTFPAISTCAQSKQVAHLKPLPEFGGSRCSVCHY